MSALVFPSLPMADVSKSLITSYKTSVYTSVSQKEQRVAWGASPRSSYKVKLNGLRTDTAAPSPWAAYDEAAIVKYFHTYHQGSYEPFWFYDPYAKANVQVRFTSDALELTQVFPGVWQCEFELLQVL